MDRKHKTFGKIEEAKIWLKGRKKNTEKKIKGRLKLINRRIKRFEASIPNVDIFLQKKSQFIESLEKSEPFLLEMNEKFFENAQIGLEGIKNIIILMEAILIGKPEVFEKVIDNQVKILEEEFPLKVVEWEIIMEKQAKANESFLRQLLETIETSEEILDKIFFSQKN